MCLCGLMGCSFTIFRNCGLNFHYVRMSWPFRRLVFLNCVVIEYFPSWIYLPAYTFCQNCMVTWEAFVSTVSHLLKNRLIIHFTFWKFVFSVIAKRKCTVITGLDRNPLIYVFRKISVSIALYLVYCDWFLVLFCHISLTRCEAELNGLNHRW